MVELFGETGGDRLEHRKLIQPKRPFNLQRRGHGDLVASLISFSFRQLSPQRHRTERYSPINLLGLDLDSRRVESWVLALSRPRGGWFQTGSASGEPLFNGRGEFFHQIERLCELTDTGWLMWQT